MKHSGTRISITFVLLVASLFAGSAGVAGAETPGGSPADRAFVVAAYQDFLGRLPTDGELTSAMSAPIDTPAARSAIVTDLAHSSEWVRVTVEHFYRDTLNRDGDDAGVAYWVEKITSGRLTVAEVAASFYSSNEYFTTIGKSDVRTWVLDLYAKILLRPGTSDPSGVDHWIQVAAKHGRYVVAYAIYQSDESRRTRVAALFDSLLGRTPDQAGLSYWAGRILTIGDLALAEGLAESQEYAVRAITRFHAPGEPTDVVATPGDGTAKVNWSAPSDGGGVLGVSSYTVSAVPGDRSCTTDGATTCTVTGLANEADYTFSVAATNLIGTGPASLSSAPASPPWRTLTSSPQSMPWAPWALNDSGQIVGNTNFNSGQPRGAACANPCTDPRMLATPAGMAPPMVSAVNANGEILGTTVDADGERQLLDWSSSTANPTVLAKPSGLSSLFVTGIDLQGEIIGYGSSDGISSEGLVWSSANAPPTVIPPPTNFSAVQLTAISPSGAIVGFAMGFGFTYEGLYWSNASAPPVVLKVPTGFRYPTPRATNASGTIVGDAQDGQGVQQALVWSSAGATPTTLGIANGYSDPYGGSISASGLITGSLTNNSTGETQGAEWATPGAAPQLLAQPAGYISTTAVGVRPDGSIVGSGADPADVAQALIWASPTESPTLLPTPNAITDVLSVSDSTPSGTAVGNGKSSTNAPQAFVWPSPGRPTVALSAPGYQSMCVADVAQTAPQGTVVVGSAVDSSNVTHALAWPVTDSAPTMLQVPPGYTASKATVITESGVIYGAGTDASGTEQGLVWSSSTAVPTMLPDPIGYQEPYQTGFKIEVKRVSSTGAVVGAISDGYWSAGLVWASATATPTYLQVLAASELDVSAISASGAIVGSSWDGHWQGVAWTSVSADPIVLLGHAGDTSVHATGISASGVIVGYGSNDAGASEGLVWQSATAAPTVLPTPPGVSDVVVDGSTPDGIVFGTARAPDGTRIGFLTALT